MNLPKNVFRFEILLYASLILDALSVAFEDRSVTATNSEQSIMAQSVISACLILLMLYLVYHAARHRKNWPRWVLIAALVLSIISTAASRSCPACSRWPGSTIPSPVTRRAGSMREGFHCVAA
jgi:protein-S-isoprenylcysteine O-methyltransferase Ste14